MQGRRRDFKFKPLSLTEAGDAICIQLVADVTGTRVAPWFIGTATIGCVTRIRALFTLVDIWQKENEKKVLILSISGQNNIRDRQILLLSITVQNNFSGSIRDNYWMSGLSPDFVQTFIDFSNLFNFTFKDNLTWELWFPLSRLAVVEA